MWFPPPTDLKLGPHEVHVWRANLDLSAAQVEELAKTLSTDEKSRAGSFYFEQHRQRFIVGRGLLRTLLGRYLQIEPGQLQFDYSPRGKPTLAGRSGAHPLQFNLSHCQGLALYGFTCDRPIGIDLEYLRSSIEAETIAQRFFSAREYTALIALPAQERQKGFFRAWTAKEAYLKATGEGLAGSLEQVEISLIPGEPSRLLSIHGNSQAAVGWSLYDLTPAPDYIATLAVEGYGWNLSGWEC
mgnify:CR=1 FL=1